MEKNLFNFETQTLLAIFVYLVLLLSCMVEITVELGLHTFDDIASHHGLAVLAVSSLIANLKKLRGHASKLIVSKDKQ